MTLTRSRLRAEIDALLGDIKRRRQIIVDHTELWGEPLDAALETQGYLAALLDYGDVRICPVPEHRRSWKHIGGQRYVCELCLKLQASIA